jgi:hypothetical protein
MPKITEYTTDITEEAKSALEVATNDGEGSPAPGQPSVQAEGGPLEGVSTTTEIIAEAEKELSTGAAQKFEIVHNLVGTRYKGEQFTFKEFCKSLNMDREAGRAELFRLIDAGAVKRVEKE